MKKNDLAQLKTATVPELEKRIKDSLEKLWALEHEMQAGKVKNVHLAHAMRKDIARMNTQIKNSNI